MLEGVTKNEVLCIKSFYEQNAPVEKQGISYETVTEMSQINL